MKSLEDLKLLPFLCWLAYCFWYHYSYRWKGQHYNDLIEECHILFWSQLYWESDLGDWKIVRIWLDEILILWSHYCNNSVLCKFLILLLHSAMYSSCESAQQYLIQRKPSSMLFIFEHPRFRLLHKFGHSYHVSVFLSILHEICFRIKCYSVNQMRDRRCHVMFCESKTQDWSYRVKGSKILTFALGICP